MKRNGSVIEAQSMHDENDPPEYFEDVARSAMRMGDVVQEVMERWPGITPMEAIGLVGLGLLDQIASPTRQGDQG